MSKVYALVDPRDRSIRYVGKTTKPLSTRRSQHIALSRRPRSRARATHTTHTTHTTQWIRSLALLGLTPDVRLLENVNSTYPSPARALNQAEIAWIAHYRRHGANLTNHTNGGDGGDTRTHTTKARGGDSNGPFVG